MKKIVKKRDRGSNLCGINLSQAENEKNGEKEGLGSNLCGITLSQAENEKKL